MADEEVKAQDGAPEGAGEGQEKGGGKGSAKLLGGILGLVAVGGSLAFMAIPAKEKAHRFEGPFLYEPFKEPITVTVRDDSRNRYVKVLFHCEYVAYEPTYLASREKDVFFLSYLRSKIGAITSDKHVEAVVGGQTREVFAEELRHAIDPIFFPVHIGNTAMPLDENEPTGLQLGSSYMDATFRGKLEDHVLHFNGPARTVRIDEGPENTFNGDEDDLRVETSAGTTVFLDVTHCNTEFVGQVQIGVHGKLRKILIVEDIAQ